MPANTFAIAPVAVDGNKWTGPASLSIATSKLVEVRAATTAEIAQFSTAVTAVIVNRTYQATPKERLYLTSDVTATLITAIG